MCLPPGSLSRLKTPGGPGTRLAAIRHVSDPRNESREFPEMTLATLVDLRRQLLCGLAEHPAWAPAEAYLARLLRAEFDPSKLEFRRIGLHSSPEVLDSVIRYEAVHAIRNRRALVRRLMADRRCFGFFHPALPNEPLAFTEVAFTRSLSAKVQPLLDPESPVIDPTTCDCAMFYSISSCHEGCAAFRLATPSSGAWWTRSGVSSRR